MGPPPMNTPVREGETIEGSRTMRNRPYPVLKCSIDGEKNGQLIRWKQEASIPAVVRIHMSRWVMGWRAGVLRLTHLRK